jgi:hypothetical protein
MGMRVRAVLQYLLKRGPGRIRYRADRVSRPRGNLSGLPYLVATKRGLFGAGPDGYRLIAPGHYYGVSLREDRIYCFEKLAGLGRVVRFRRRGDRVVDGRVVIRDLSEGGHQIDWAGGFLYVTDTYNNRVLKYDTAYRQVGEFFPLGPCENGRASENYAHINSILFFRGDVYLVCHNETAKTGRRSQVLRCDADFNVIQVYEDCGASAHNIVFLPDGTGLVCDSGGARVIDLRGTVRAKVDLFARGLSVNGTGIVVGGSELAKRSARERGAGKLYFFGPDFTPRGAIVLPGMVQEVRRLDGDDYSLSAYWEQRPTVGVPAVAG